MTCTYVLCYFYVICSCYTRKRSKYKPGRILTQYMGTERIYVILYLLYPVNFSCMQFIYTSTYHKLWKHSGFITSYIQQMKILRTGKLFSSKPERKRSFVTKIMFVHKSQRDGEMSIFIIVEPIKIIQKFSFSLCLYQLS